MSVFISHAPADQEVAQELETVLERRGHFVELDDGQTALRPVTPHDVLVLLVSKDLLFAPMRLRLEQRALDAWADGRLLVVKLDHGIAPVGLRDLPAIDASFAAQRSFKWLELSNSIRGVLQASMRAPPPGGATPSEEGPDRGIESTQSRGGGIGPALVGALAVLPGLGALAAIASIWLANRIGPAPGTLADLVAGIDALGGRIGLAAGVTPTLFAIAIALMLVVAIVALVARLRASQSPSASRAREEMSAEASALSGQSAVFVSYASANAKAVLPVIEAAQKDGCRFWLDKKGIAAGDGWAGEIVRAIRNAGGVLVMCSKAAFESDHVKREVYLADRYRRKLIPVYIEDAEPPEDFEYFFSGVQHLRLFETPEPERAQALARILGTPA